MLGQVLEGQPRRVSCQQYGFVETPTYCYVGRQAGRLGNPFHIARNRSRAQAVRAFERWVKTKPDLMAYIKTLRGKDIGCHCGPRQLCHGDVVLRLANAPEAE